MTYAKMSVPFRATFQFFDIPEEIQNSLWYYFMYGIDPGGFGIAILRNDFCNAVCKAHVSLTSNHLRHIAIWFMNTRLPEDSHGSGEKIKQWQSLTDDQRRAAMEDVGLYPTLFDVLRSVPGA